MLKRIALLGLMVTLGATLAAPLFAAQAIQGAVGNISAADNNNLGSSGVGQPGTVGCRVYSLSDPGINNNIGGVCLNNRCLRNYNSNTFLNPGGYQCNGEGTAAYANDLDNQTFYELIDGQGFAGACNHTAFYSAQGQVAKSAGAPTGDFRLDGCPGASAVNCFERTSSGDGRTVPLLNVNSGYSSAHSTNSVGGLSPVPTVRVASPGAAGCPAGQSRLTWDEPELYLTSMKDGVASPVKGVRLYSNSSPCNTCPNGDTGWTAGAAFAVGAGGTGTCVPVVGQTWYALTVRLIGPGGGANEIETGRVGSAGFVGANSQCVTQDATAVRIANLSARYSGRGTVAVNFTTGIEGGVSGYFVTRGTSPSGPFTRVSEQLSPRGDGSAYSVNDKVRSALGRTLYYSVEIVNADGTIDHSSPSAVNLPAAKQKLGAR